MYTELLALLADLASAEVVDDAPVEQALDVMRRCVGATRAGLIYGAPDGFRQICVGDALALTPVALWLLQRDLVSRNRACAFDLVGSRAVRFRPIDPEAASDFVACLLPTPSSTSEMLVLHGPWPTGFRDEAFLRAAEPALALISAKRTERFHAEQGEHQLSALMNIAQVISQSQDIEQVLTDIARGIAQVTGIEFATIDLTDHEGTISLRCVNYDPPNTDDGLDRWKRAMARPDPIRRSVVQTRQPATFVDAQNDDRLTEAARRFFSESLIRSTAVFPMVAQQELIGALSIGARHPLAFDADQCAMFGGLATQAATAVSGIRLYEQLAQKSAQLEDALEAERMRSSCDSLTGVWNHAAIADLLQQHIDQQANDYLAVAMVDVDGMKTVNDTYGHLVGDELLKHVAEALAQDGVLVGRYGGDEFLVLLPGAHRARAQEYVEHVTNETPELCVVDEESHAAIRVGLSVGIAIYPDEAREMSDLIRAADADMYSAKSRRFESGGSDGRRINDRVSRLIDELVPLLTSAAGLDEKLALVAERLSEGTGYDAVECRLFPSGSGGVTAHTVLVDGKAGEWTEAWRLDQQASPRPEDRPASAAMARTLRPVINDDVTVSDHLTVKQLALLAAMGLRSTLSIPMVWQGRMIGQLSVASRRVAAFAAADAQFLVSIAAQVTAIVRMATLVDGLQVATDELENAQAETVMMLAAAAEAHDRTTGLHLLSVRTLSEALATELGYNGQDVYDLGLAATLHDIGKISVPDNILSSPMRFERDDFEMAKVWEQLKRHSVLGAEFLAGRQGFELAAQVARWHHESWDGSGYPDRLIGEQIPERVAIVTVADAYDAMTSDRPYRASRSAMAAVMEIVHYKGKQFSPTVVDALVRLQQKRALPPQAAAARRAA